jgi:heme A synthase
LALILLIVSFFARIPGGVRWATIVLVLVVVQVLLGMFLHGTTWLGMLHGINALALFGVAVGTARRVPPADVPSQPQTTQSALT